MSTTGEEAKAKDPSKKKAETLKILEWRYNQFLGEKLSYEQIKSDPENETFLVTNIAFSNDGNNVVVADKGGRAIIFKRSEEKTKAPKLNYYFEYQAQEKDFDVHKSVEYSEEIKGLSILPKPVNEEKLDILTAGFRTIKLDRIYQTKLNEFDTESKKKNDINIPVLLASTPNDFKCKTKKLFCCAHSSEINSLSVNKFNSNFFISSDEERVYLWDLNNTKGDVYTPVTLNIDYESDDQYQEKITKSAYSNNNPHVFIYGTSKGKLALCDLRTSSSQLSFETSFMEEGKNMTKTIANALLSVHDICTNLSNDYSFASRHYFSVNLWDIRKGSLPTNKFLLYEPIINKLTYIFQQNYINDKFSLDSDASGKYIITGGYNNMFHVIDIDQRLNSQIKIDDSNEKLMNTNVIRKINAKGSCFYKKNDPDINVDFNKKILHQAYSPIDNFGCFVVFNCLYTYFGNYTKNKGK